MFDLPAMFLGLSSVDVRPGVPWWQHWGLKTVGPTVDTSHILRIHPCCRSDGSFQGQHPCWGEQRSTCSQVDGSKQEYSWQLTWGWRYRRRVDRLPVHMWSVLVTKPHNVHNFWMLLVNYFRSKLQYKWLWYHQIVVSIRIVLSMMHSTYIRCKQVVQDRAQYDRVSMLGWVRAKGRESQGSVRHYLTSVGSECPG